MAVSLNKLAQTVDEYYEVRQLRLEKDREAAELKKKESELKEFLIDNISKSDASGVAGKLMRATLQSKTEPTPEDWSLIHKYILKTKSFDLLQLRLSVPAVVERWNDDVSIPGVGRIQVISISLSKL